MTQHPPLGVDVRSLHVRFGDVEAVAGVDLAAYAGQATGLLGRNGAGKSTTMRVLAGVVPPTAGTALVAGHDVRHDTLAVKRAVGYCPDVGGLVPAGDAVGAPPARRAAAPADRLGGARPRPARAVRARRRRPPGHRRLLATAWAGGSRSCSPRSTSPTCCCSTSPSTASTRSASRRPSTSIADARARGACVLVSTHLRELAVEACGEVLVLRGGSRVATVDAGEMAGEEGARAYRALLD